MEAIDQLIEALEKQPNQYCRFDVTRRSLELKFQDECTAWINEDCNEWTVGFEGWHDHFDCEADAVRCFCQLMCGECRLEVSDRGNSAYRWAIQRMVDEGWRTVSTTGLLSFAFWRWRRTEYRSIPKVEWV